MIYEFTKKPSKPFVRHVYKTQEEFLYKRKRFRIKQARLEFPHEHDLETLYKLFCIRHNLNYIPKEYLHEYASNRQKTRSRPWDDKRIKCMECGQITVSVDRLCGTLPKYKEGYRSSLFCSNCLATTFSKFSPQEVLEHG